MARFHWREADAFGRLNMSFTSDPSSARILLDAEYVSRRKAMRSHQRGIDALQSQTTDLETVYAQFERIIQYCAAAQFIGKPVDVLEVVNDGSPSVLDRSPNYSLADIPSGRLWRHLGTGFVYNGVLRNKAIVLAELQEARRRTIASGDVWDPEENQPHLVNELNDPVALVGLVS
ncbi:hypothetical protein PENSPDRAFT_749809 [Peniophora sp. CONT]|nr:hypothetical protein PENSPDRAFT_749809 [Peniophora sp. CONT]